MPEIQKEYLFSKATNNATPDLISFFKDSRLCSLLFLQKNHFDSRVSTVFAFRHNRQSLIFECWVKWAQDCQQPTIIAATLQHRCIIAANLDG